MRWNNHTSHERRGFPVAIVAVLLLGVMPWSSALSDEPAEARVAGQAQSRAVDQPAFRTELVRGKVVWLAEGLKSEFGISTVPEVAENSLAILSDDRHLIPIVENLRGRAFRRDPRLREMHVEILARRYHKQPHLQILRLYEIDGDQRYEIDYWCDVCAIVMYETGPCSCCQDDNRLRKRLIEDPESLLPDASELESN